MTVVSRLPRVRRTDFQVYTEDGEHGGRFAQTRTKVEFRRFDLGRVEMSF